MTTSDYFRVLLPPEDNYPELVSITFSAASFTNPPHFDFSSTMMEVGCVALQVKDPSTHWYQSAIDGLCDDPDDLARRLEEEVATTWPGRKVVTVGSSMGGYGALMIAGLMKARASIVFGAQCNISSEFHLPPKLRRWVNNIPRVIYDEVGELSHNVGAIEAWVGSDCGVDRLHAECLCSETTTIQTLRKAKHKVGMTLKKRGLLTNVFRQFYGGL